MGPSNIPLNFPLSFKAAFLLTKQILGESSRLKSEGRMDPEAEQLLIAVYRFMTGLTLSRMDLFARMGESSGNSNFFSKAAADQLFGLARRRVEGVPLQYLIGFQWFRDHEYEVGRGVLIPRPETEVLLDAVFKEFLSSKIIPKLGLEVGLGSGILSIELLSYFPTLRMLASELTDAACEVARRNVCRVLQIESIESSRLTLVRPESASQGLEAFDRQGWAEPAADFIISNPPYLGAESEVDADVLSHEPHEALFAPQGDPLFFYNNIIDKGRKYLKSNGFVFVELPHERSQIILEQFLKKGWLARTLPDLTGRDRVLIARLAPS